MAIRDLWYRPAPEDATVVDYKNVGRAATDETAGYEATGLGTPREPGWRPTAATPSKTRVYQELDGPLTVRGAEIDWPTASPTARVEVVAGLPAELNGITLDALAQSGTVFATSAASTLVVVFRVMHDTASATTEKVIAWLGTTWGSTYDYAILMGSVAQGRNALFRWNRYTSPVDYASSEPIYDGRVYTLALTTSGTTGKAYVLRPGYGESVVQLGGSVTISAHSSQTGQQLTFGGEGANFARIELLRGYYVKQELDGTGIGDLLSNLSTAVPSANLNAAYLLPSTDVGTTTATDSVGTGNLTVPNTWITRPNPWAASRAEPVHGPAVRRSVLCFSANGSSNAKPVTPTGRIPKTYSIPFMLRRPKSASSAAVIRVVFFYGATYNTRDALVHITSADELSINALRVSGSSKSTSTGASYRDGEFHRFLLLMDEASAELRLWADGALVATVSAVSAHVASSTAQLWLGSRTAGADESRVDIMGPIGVYHGLLTWDQAAAMMAEGVSFDHDPRWEVGYALDPADVASAAPVDRGLEGTGAMDLVLGAGVSWLPPQAVPGTFTRNLGRTERLRGPLPLAFGADVDADSILWRLYDPTGSVHVRCARAWDGTGDLGGSSVPRSEPRADGSVEVQAELYLTDAMAETVRGLIGEEVVLVSQRLDSVTDRRLASVRGRLVSAPMQQMLAHRDAEQYSWAATLTIESEGA